MLRASKVKQTMQYALLTRILAQFPDQVKVDRLISRRKRKLRDLLRSSAIGIHDDAMIVSSSPRHQRACRVLVTEIEASSVGERWSVG